MVHYNWKLCHVLAGTCCKIQGNERKRKLYNGTAKTIRFSRMIHKHDSRSLHKADHCQHLMFAIAASLGGTTRSFHCRVLEAAATQGVVGER